MIYVKAIAGLLLCVGLILAAAHFARLHRDKLERLFSGNLLAPTKQRRLKSIERLQLAPGHVAVLFQQDEAEHLVILSPEGASIVATNPQTDRPE